jgi:hypothetical protein
MATPEEIEDVQDLLPDDAADYGWDTDKISAMIDSGVTGNALLVSFWDKVSSSTSGYVDMSESGSSRALSQIHKNAVSMAKTYRDLLDKENAPPTVTTGIRSRAIRRV